MAADRVAASGSSPTGAACRKCGSDDIGTRYHAKGCDKPHCSCSNCIRGSNETRHDEHLHLFCRGCGFDWTTEVLSRG